ncbi:MAG: hypothetical protein ACRD9L_27225, partial [Bryobacteraceae bacterium]
DHRELWLFKERSIEVFDDTGAANFPFERNPAGFIEQGIIAAASPVRLDNTVFWLGGDERGAGVVWRAQGYTPSRVSNHSMETAIQSYPTITDAEFWGYQQDGHSFLVCHFPSAFPTPMGGVRGATWVYDCAASAMIGAPQWHERAYWDPIHAVWMMHRGRCHAYCFGKHLIGDWLAGKIYELNPKYRQDDQNPLRWLRSAPHLSDEMKLVFYDELLIDMDVGEGLANDIPVVNTQTSPETAVGINDTIAEINAHIAAGPQPVTIGSAGSDPKVILRWSNDGAKTWVKQRLLSAGKIGEYLRRVRKTRMGQARTRTYELSGSDPVPVAIVGAYLKTTPGNGS